MNYEWDKIITVDLDNKKMLLAWFGLPRSRKEIAKYAKDYHAQRRVGSTLVVRSLETPDSCEPAFRPGSKKYKGGL